MPTNPEPKTRYHARLILPTGELAIINRHLHPKSPDDYQGEENTRTHSVHFNDETIMDIKCCGDDEAASWVEAVLFQPTSRFQPEAHGITQVAYSDPTDEYLGQYELEDDNGNLYVVDVTEDPTASDIRIEMLGEQDHRARTR